MKELDFLFIYEHKVRELENLCLMKYELDRRGYKTKIVYVDDADMDDLKAIRDAGVEIYIQDVPGDIKERIKEI